VHPAQEDPVLSFSFSQEQQDYGAQLLRFARIVATTPIGKATTPTGMVAAR
jgi:hypothetical protein